MMYRVRTTVSAPRGAAVLERAARSRPRAHTTSRLDLFSTCTTKPELQECTSYLVRRPRGICIQIQTRNPATHATGEAQGHRHAEGQTKAGSAPGSPGCPRESGAAHARLNQNALRDVPENML